MSFSFTAIIILQLYSLSPVIIIIFISFFLLLLSVCVFRFFIERYCIDVTSFDMTSFSHLPHYLYITTGLFLSFPQMHVFAWHCDVIKMQTTRAHCKHWQNLTIRFCHKLFHDASPWRAICVLLSVPSVLT